MNKVTHNLLFSCLKATELVEKKFHFKLSFKEKLQLKLHLTMCDVCLRYQKQSHLIEKVMAVLHDSSISEVDSKELKSNISKQLELDS